MKYSGIPGYIILLLFLATPHIRAEKIEIITTGLQIAGQKLEISYDILKSKNTHRFDVWVEITDSEGNPVNARTFHGDVGSNQKGGRDKRIVWDYNADGIVLNETVVVHVKAVAGIVEGAVRPGNALLKSVVLPGWGLSSVDHGKPYWLIGIAAYGSLSASVTFLLSSDNNYNLYEETNDPDLSTLYYNRYENYATASTAFGYTALGIWAATGIWTIIKANRINSSLTAWNRNCKVNFCSHYDPYTKTMGFALQYHF